MLWNEDTPVVKQPDINGVETSVKVIAGELGAVKALDCPPDSWAADKDNHVAIWLIDIPEGGLWTLPSDHPGLNRTLYFFEGESVVLEGVDVSVKEAFVLKSDEAASIQNTGKKARFLLLQGRPIGEHVEQHGPFVMNTRQELQKAFHDYQRTQFGGWPWPRNDQVHDKTKGRFAYHADKLDERPT